jgi:hypothetical protein
MSIATQDRPLGVLEAYDALDAFGRRVGRVPLLLLLHAAVPQSFRADLLNLLKVNFLTAEAGTDMTVDADVLLSSLVQPAAAGYYRLDPQVRRHCLDLLDAVYRDRKERRTVEVAWFLLAYADAVERKAALGLDALLSEYLAIQRWVAFAFIEPRAAAAAFARAISGAVDSGKPVATLRLGSLTAAISIPLAGEAGLLAYARGIDAIAQGDADRARRLLEWTSDQELHVGGVTLRPGREVLTRFARGETASASQPRASAPSTAIRINLPSRMVVMVGRQEEIAIVRRLLLEDMPPAPGSSGPSVIDIVGADGMGKWTLANALVHDPAVVESFRDGMIWLGEDGSGYPTQAIEEYGKTIEVHDLLDEQRLVRVDRFRTLFSNRRVLFIADRRFTSGIEQTILKEAGPRCAVMRLLTGGVGAVVLAPLDPAECLSILESLGTSPRPREGVERLARLQGNPLLVRLFASAVSLEPVALNSEDIGQSVSTLLSAVWPRLSSDARTVLHYIAERQPAHRSWFSTAELDDGLSLPPEQMLAGAPVDILGSHVRIHPLVRQALPHVIAIPRTQESTAERPRDAEDEERGFATFASEDQLAAQEIMSTLGSVGIVFSYANATGEHQSAMSRDEWVQEQIINATVYLPVLSKTAIAPERASLRFREWRIALDEAQRRRAGRPFIFPVVVDDLLRSAPGIPAEFQKLLWLRAQGGQLPNASVEVMRRMRERGISAPEILAQLAQTFSEVVERVPREPAKTEETKSASAPVGDRYYDFYFSFSSIDWRRRQKDDLETLFQRISSKLRELGLTDGGFFAPDSRHGGQGWEPSLIQALSASRILVPIYSPNYFKSNYCGKEWQVFAEREQENRSTRRPADVTAPEVILPILWTAPITLPQRVSDVQMSHGADPQVYLSRGLGYMIQAPRRFSYQVDEFIDRFGRDLARMATSQGAAKMRSISDWNALAPPFPPTHRQGVLVSYSHVDKMWSSLLQQYLAPLIPETEISLLDDRTTEPNGRETFERELEEAGVVVLLVTPDYLASTFGPSGLISVFSRAQRKGVRIVWIAVSDSGYTQTDLARYPALNDPQEPLEGLATRERNRRLAAICKEIVAQLRDPLKSEQPVAPTAPSKSGDSTVGSMAIRVRLVSDNEPLRIERQLRDGIVLAGDASESPRRVLLEFEPASEATRERMRRVRQRHNWSPGQFQLVMSLEDGELVLRGVDAFALPEGIYKGRLSIEDLVSSKGWFKADVPYEGEATVRVTTRRDDRQIRLTAPVMEWPDPLKRLMIAPESQLDGQSLPLWLNSTTPRASRKACLLNTLAVLCAQRSPLVVESVKHVLYVDTFRVYVEVTSECREMLKRASDDQTKPFYAEGPVDGAPHLRILDRAGVKGTYSFESYRREGKPTLVMVVASPERDTDRCFAALELDIGSPLQDASGFMIHLGELKEGRTSDQFKTRDILRRNKATEFIFYEVAKTSAVSP